MTQEATRTKATFPSVDWFNAIKEIVNTDEGYKRLGTCDAEVGVKIPDLQKYYKITFEAFEVADIKEVDERDAEDADFWLEMPYARWKDTDREHQGQRQGGPPPHPEHDRPGGPGRLRPLKRRLPPRRLLPLQPDVPVLLRRLRPDRHQLRLVETRREQKGEAHALPLLLC